MLCATHCLQACDKLTYINNRDLLYDLNSYINNVRVILHACNNYLKVSPTLSILCSNIADIALSTVDWY